MVFFLSPIITLLAFLMTSLLSILYFRSSKKIKHEALLDFCTSRCFDICNYSNGRTDQNASAQPSPKYKSSFRTFQHNGGIFPPECQRQNGLRRVGSLW